MTHLGTAPQIDQQLAAILTGQSSGARSLFLPLLRALVSGDGVDVSAFAAAMGRPASAVEAQLAELPVERDERGRIVGLGLTHRPTPHIFEVDGRRLYTWCALDSLIFPSLLGVTASVRSPCPETGTIVTMTVSLAGVHDVEPSSACVSLVPADDGKDVRSTFCVHVSFFSTPEAARLWRERSNRERVQIVSIEEAHGLATQLAQRIAKGGSDCCG